MKKTKFKKLLSLLVCVVLVAAVALTATGCKDNQTDTHQSSGVVETTPTVKFTFTVVHKDGSEKAFTVATDKSTVGEALQDEGVISGESSEYGLFVKTVDGETLDYNTDGYWWSFYIDDQMATTGVDQTSVENGKTYYFKAEKA